MLNPYVDLNDVVFSRLAANTLGFAFAVVLTVSPVNFGTILGLGLVCESPQTRAEKFTSKSGATPQKTSYKIP
jgi:hypothetical protein